MNVGVRDLVSSVFFPVFLDVTKRIFGRVELLVVILSWVVVIKSRCIDGNGYQRCTLSWH